MKPGNTGYCSSWVSPAGRRSEAAPALADSILRSRAVRWWMWGSGTRESAVVVMKWANSRRLYNLKSYIGPPKLFKYIVNFLTIERKSASGSDLFFLILRK